MNQFSSFIIKTNVFKINFELIFLYGYCRVKRVLVENIEFSGQAVESLAISMRQLTIFFDWLMLPNRKSNSHGIKQHSDIFTSIQLTVYS